MSVTDDARLRELVRKADLPDTSLTDRKLYTVEAECHEFLRKRGLIHKLTSRYSPLPVKRSIGYQVVQLLVNLLDLWAVQRAISVQLSSLSLSRALMLGEVASSQITSSNPLSLFRHWPATKGVLLTFLTGFPDHLIGPTTEW